SVLGHFWSLAVEEQFYLCWPFVVFYVAERRVPLVILGLYIVAVGAKIGMAFVGFGWFQIYSSLFTRMDSLVLGSLSAYAYVFRNDVSTDRIAKIALWVSSATLLILFISFHGFSMLSRPVLVSVTPIMAIFCSAGIYSLLQSKQEQGLKKFCSLPVLRFFGKYSYGLYVYHYIINLVVLHLTGVEAVKHPFLPALCVFVSVNALSLIISIISFHAFESQFLKLRTST
ncbi:MAG: acyltransferase, partial [Proteobacteria bacterium]